jgi:hypothetical protein
MKPFTTRVLRGAATGLLALAAIAVRSAAAADVEWPQDITTPKATITIYQPQPESFKGDTLTGRAAMSFLTTGKKDPIFGAFWFTAKVETDLDTRTGVIRSVTVTKVRWADATEAEQTEFSGVVQNAFPEKGIPISLDRLSASLATAEKEQKSLEGLKNDPPKIVFSETLAELLLYDGEPKTVPVENTGLERVANCAFAVVRQKSSGDYFLAGGGIWYTAKDPKGPWSSIAKPPDEVAKAVPPPEEKIQAPKRAPAIVVATEPTELVVTDGKPNWKPIGKGELLYVENTETPLLREVASGQVYILASGRWFRSASLDGSWTFVRPDQVPSSFKEIPPASDLSGVRVSVAGTDEAEDAMLDAQIPQTAAIKRSEAKLEVTYDGEPQFKKIEGTGVEYAVNTGAQVLRIGGKYYACDNAVWFVSSAAAGPWVVADSVPSDEIKQIPPSAPVYNVTNVTVYNSTPDVVYVGYTPGYMWSYPYYGVPVYGTGWYYPPYWGPVYPIYYPRPCTYGFHVGYNPWTGWNYGFSWSVGFISVGVSWGGHGGYYGHGYHGGGWYGPGGYRPPVNIINTGDINIGNKVNIGSGNKRTTNRTANNNLYRSGDNRGRITDRGTRDLSTQQLKSERAAAGKANNVFADKDGNVYRRNNDGSWDNRASNGGWTRDKGVSTARPDAGGAATRPAAKPQVQSPAQPKSQPWTAPSGLDRDYSARQRGSSRVSHAPSMSRGGGGGGFSRRR